MRNRFGLAIATVIAALFAPSAVLAHVERPAYWPDPAPDCSIKPCTGGKVPAIRSLASALDKKKPGTTRVVCQPDSMKLLKASVAKAVKDGGLEAINDMVMSRYFSDDFRAAQPAIVKEMSRRFLETPVEGYLGCCDAIAKLDYKSDLSRIHARTLVIAGAADAGTPPVMSQAIADGIPGSQLAVIPEAAHLSAVEKPQEFGALVKGFLAAP